MKEIVRVRNEEVRGLSRTDFCPYAESFVFVYHFLLAYSPSVYMISSTRVYVCMRGSIAVCACLYVCVCIIILELRRVCVCVCVCGYVCVHECVSVRLCFDGTFLSSFSVSLRDHCVDL